MARRAILAALTSTLAACASAPTPELRPAWYETVQAGRVAPGQASRMADCVMDAWSGAHGILTSTTADRQRRADGERIEVRTGGAVIARADITDAGEATMTQWAHAPIGTGTEREAFASCLARYASTM